MREENQYLAWDVIEFNALDDTAKVKFGTIEPCRTQENPKTKKMTFFFDSIVGENWASSVTKWSAMYVPNREFNWLYDNVTYRCKCTVISLSKNDNGFHAKFKLQEV